MALGGSRILDKRALLLAILVSTSMFAAQTAPVLYALALRALSDTGVPHSVALSVTVLGTPSKYWTTFDFKDAGGNPVNNQVQWTLFDQTGVALDYVQGSPTLEAATYTLEVYYPESIGQPLGLDPYMIHNRTLVPSNQTVTVPLVMTSHNSVAGGYIASNSAATVTISTQTITALVFSVESTSSFTLVVKVPRRPDFVQRNGIALTDTEWFYSPELMVVRIPTVEPGTFSVVLLAPRLPTISFVDGIDHEVSNVVMRIVDDAQGVQIPYVPGGIVPTGSYMLEVEYGGYRIYRQPLDLYEVDPITLPLVPLGTTGNYIIVVSDSTVEVYGAAQVSDEKISFSLGGGASLIAVKVPKRPLYVERDGSRIASWVYNQTVGTVEIESGILGRFTVVLDNPGLPLLLTLPGITGMVLGAGAALGGVLFFLRRRRDSRQSGVDIMLVSPDGMGAKSFCLSRSGRPGHGE